MKLELSAIERKYLYALCRLFAYSEKERQAKEFWVDLGNRLGPNQLVAHLRKKEVEHLLDIITKAVHTISVTTERELELGQGLRADVLLKVLAGARSKLENKLANNEESKDGI